MSQHTIKSFQCWFCTKTNPSYLPECGTYGGATIPARDPISKKKVQWRVFSFGSKVPVDHQSRFFFSDVMKNFDTQSKVAIRFGDEHIQHVLVRHSQHGKTFHSVKETDGEDRIAFFSFYERKSGWWRKYP
jgi:hypothetical protein